MQRVSEFLCLPSREKFILDGSAAVAYNPDREMPMPPLNAMQMFDEMVNRGYINPADSEPFGGIPSAFVSVQTALAFSTPSVKAAVVEGLKNAKLGRGAQRNSKRAGRSKKR